MKSCRPSRSARGRSLSFPRFRIALVLAAILSSSGVVCGESHISAKLADGFDFPVGWPNSSGYYKARGYWPNGHLGEDWNGRGGGNTDLGDTIYAMGAGVVVYSDDFKLGWGNVVIIRHAYREKNGRVYFIDSLYGHLERRDVRLHQKVNRGQKVGTMGRGPRNMYYAHLHFEIRKNLAIGMNRSKYPRDYSCYHSPTQFINANRRLRSEQRTVPMPLDTFLKSNPNVLQPTKLTSMTAPARTPSARRPAVPTPVREVIRTRNDDDSDTDDTRGFWSKLKSRLGGGKGVDDSEKR